MNSVNYEKLIIELSHDLTRLRELNAHCQNYTNHENALEAQRDSAGFLPGGIVDALERTRTLHATALREMSMIAEKYGKKS